MIIKFRLFVVIISFIIAAIITAILKEYELGLLYFLSAVTLAALYQCIGDNRK